MHVFNNSQFDNHEQISFFNCPSTGLKAIIAVHNTNLGPGLGGCRMWNYKNDAEALHDVLRLSRGMTYKNAMAGIPVGGGKSVILGNSSKDKTAALMHSMGRAVSSLGGNYIVAEDVGISVEDVNYMSETCDYVTGLSKNNEGSGDPSPMTAYGVYLSLKPAVKQRLKKDSLQGLSVSIQGLGHVGYYLCKHLHEEGVNLYVSDIDDQKVKQVVSEFGAIPIPVHEIYDVKADIFAPCALGGILNDETIQRLNVSIVAGAANNQLEDAGHSSMLSNKDILFAPDYVINAGGVISVYYGYAARHGIPFNQEQVVKHVEKIPTTLEIVFAYADKHGLTPATAADSLAEQIFKKTTPAHSNA